MLDTTLIHGYKPTHLADEGLPWHPFTPYSDEVMLKIFHVDPVRGEVIGMLKLPAGMSLATHNHYGRVLVYTVSGSWRYLEHDWISKPGDFVYEVAHAQHTPVAEPGEDVVIFFDLEGALEFLDENGDSVALETSKTFMDRYDSYCAEHGIEPVDLTEFSLS